MTEHKSGLAHLLGLDRRSSWIADPAGFAKSRPALALDSHIQR
jgi:hypothetical protein